ncbi:MAG: MBL fold metallo-hydrolase [Anaerolineae bacterium]
MTIEIKSMTLGMVSTNAYLVGDTQTKEAILIDPVDKAKQIKALADDLGWAIKLILATHAHFDHVLASKDLKALTGAPFWIHERATPLLENLPMQGRLFGLGEFSPAAEPDHLIKHESETITLSAITLEPLYTPGHAEGHLSFYMREQSVLFSGDTLFFNSIGRTDLPGGDHQLLLRSIREKLLILPDETIVLPGHMQQTTIGFERQNNPFL